MSIPLDKAQLRRDDLTERRNNFSLIFRKQIGTCAAHTSKLRRILDITAVKIMRKTVHCLFPFLFIYIISVITSESIFTFQSCACIATVQRIVEWSKTSAAAIGFFILKFKTNKHIELSNFWITVMYLVLFKFTE